MAIAPAAQGYLFNETCSRNSYFFRRQRDDRDIRYTGCPGNPGNISRPVSIPPGLVNVEQNISGGFSKATPHIHSTNPKDGAFGDICSVIRNTLEIACDANRPCAPVRHRTLPPGTSASGAWHGSPKTRSDRDRPPAEPTVAVPGKGRPRWRYPACGHAGTDCASDECIARTTMARSCCVHRPLRRPPERLRRRWHRDVNAMLNPFGIGTPNNYHGSPSSHPGVFSVFSSVLYQVLNTT
jgi:hypothetical protein